MKKILILNGPNLNMLGLRDPEIYGSQTLQDIEEMCFEAAHQHDLKIDFIQSNHEGALVDTIQESRGVYSGIIINAAAYTHTSLAIHDALQILQCPIIEVHISNPKEREVYRHHSYIEPLAKAVIAGHGAKGYVMAVEKLADLLT